MKGTPEKVQRLIEEEQALLGINELLAYSPIFDPQKRLDSYKHLARMFNKIWVIGYAESTQREEPHIPVDSLKSNGHLVSLILINDQ